MAIPKKIRKHEQREIALERINQLFKEAEKAFKKHPERANRYVELARKIAMRTRTRIPKQFKRRFCKHCYVYLVPGVNCRIRIKESMIVYFCSNCGKNMRIPFIREKKERREKSEEDGREKERKKVREKVREIVGG